MVVGEMGLMVVVEEMGSGVGKWTAAEEDHCLISAPCRSPHSGTVRTCACLQFSHLADGMRLLQYSCLCKMRKHSEFLHLSSVLWKPSPEHNLLCFQLYQHSVSR